MRLSYRRGNRCVRACGGRQPHRRRQYDVDQRLLTRTLGRSYQRNRLGAIDVDALCLRSVGRRGERRRDRAGIASRQASIRIQGRAVAGNRIGSVARRAGTRSRQEGRGQSDGLIADVRDRQHSAARLTASCHRASGWRAGNTRGTRQVLWHSAKGSRRILAVVEQNPAVPGIHDVQISARIQSKTSRCAQPCEVECEGISVRRSSCGRLPDCVRSAVRDVDISSSVDRDTIGHADSLAPKKRQVEEQSRP